MRAQGSSAAAGSGWPRERRAPAVVLNTQESILRRAGGRAAVGPPGPGPWALTAASTPVNPLTDLLRTSPGSLR